MFKCINCGSSDLFTWEIEDNLDKVKDKVECRNCGSTWTNVYVLDRIDEIVIKHVKD